MANQEVTNWRALRRDLLRRRPYMPEQAQGIASNLIEQARNVIRNPHDAARLRPRMAYQTARLRAALQGESRDD